MYGESYVDIIKANPNIKYWNVSDINDTILDALATNSKDLETLILKECRDITNAGKKTVILWF